MFVTSRRHFLRLAGTTLAGGGLWLKGADQAQAADRATDAAVMQLGLVTYNWGKDWDLPTLLANCEETGFAGVELRTTHKHGVEPILSDRERAEVAARFADSPVQLAGLGTVCEYQATDPDLVKKNIEESKAFIRLCHDVGGGGIKVRPNGLPEGVPVEKTLSQIGHALREVAEYGTGYGVAVRLEVHGHGTSELEHIKSIFDAADHENLYVCWNCNAQDLEGEGLRHNFKLVADRIGTVHIHDLRSDAYPWQELFALLKEARFEGWTLLEDGEQPADIVQAMHENRRLWQQLVAG
jgi:sugar phosphate isomerase/epimerase